MSVIINGMEIPKGCADCVLNRDSICLAIEGCLCDESNGSVRRTNCPLVEITDRSALGYNLRTEAKRVEGYPAAVALMRMAADAIEELLAKDTNVPSKWISVDERLPEIDMNVLVYAVGKIDGFIGDTVIAISRRSVFRLFPWNEGVEIWENPWQYFTTDYEVTHWMPLPEPPKEDKS